MILRSMSYAFCSFELWTILISTVESVLDPSLYRNSRSLRLNARLIKFLTIPRLSIIKPEKQLFSEFKGSWSVSFVVQNFFVRHD